MLYTLDQIKKSKYPWVSTPLAGVHVTVGGSSPLIADRKVEKSANYYNFGAGWSAAIDKMRAQIDSAELPNNVFLQLHNPWGTLNGEDMQADQYLYARAAGLKWLSSRSFVGAVRRISKERPVVAYIGGPQNSAALGYPVNPGDLNYWVDRAVRSIKPALDAGCWIAFDAIGQSAGIELELFNKLKDSGRVVLFEGWPYATAATTITYPRVFTDYHCSFVENDNKPDPALADVSAIRSVAPYLLHYNVYPKDYWATGNPPPSENTAEAIAEWLPAVYDWDYKNDFISLLSLYAINIAGLKWGTITATV